MADSDSEPELFDFTQLVPTSDVITSFQTCPSGQLIVRDTAKLIEKLESGFNPNNVDNQGWTLQHYAAVLGSVDVIKTLVKNSQHSLRWDSLTHLSETPLFLACQFHRPFEVVKCIVDLDKNVVSAATFELVTPLHKVAESIDSKVAEYLIINGADINAINNVGYTPLMDAIRGEFWETVYCLLTYGADVSIHGADNMNALTIAVSRNYNKDHIKTLVLFTNGNEVSLKACDYRLLVSSIMIYADYDITSFFIKKIKKDDDMLNLLFFAILMNDGYSNDSWVKIIFDIIPTFSHILQTKSRNVISAILYHTKHRDIEIGTVEQIVYTFLSYGTLLFFYDIETCHKYYGYHSVFNVLERCGTGSVIMPSSCADDIWSPVCFLFKPFHYCLKTGYDDMCAIPPYYRCPTLLELSRNTLCQHINDYVKSKEPKESFGYFHYLSKLRLPKCLINVMLFDS